MTNVEKLAGTARYSPPAPASMSAMTSVEVATELQAIGQENWNGLWARAEVPSVFARYEWIDAWWQAFGSNHRLRVYVVRNEGRLVGILPTAWPDSGQRPVVLLGDEHADYAVILTDAKAPGAFGSLLKTVTNDLPRGSRLLLRDVRSDSSYERELAVLAGNGSERWVMNERTSCPRTSLNAERLQALVNKDSLRRHSRKLAKLGSVKVGHYEVSDEIQPRLEAFFEQHVARWASTDSPSLFLKPANRAFYRALAAGFDGSGLLLFTEITLDGRPVACHFGFASEGDLIWYKPTFDPSLAKVSPGEVLLRELLLKTAAMPLGGFDFTRGDEAFKHRFADHERHASTYQWYASRASAIAAKTVLRLKRAAHAHLPEPVMLGWQRVRNPRQS